MSRKESNRGEEVEMIGWEVERVGFRTACLWTGCMV